MRFETGGMLNVIIHGLLFMALLQNVLLRHPAKSAIKVIDFGSSCFEHEKSKWFSMSERPIPDRSFSLHLYSESLLPLAGSHPGHELPYGDRYVESGLHHGRALYRIPYLPR